jgi:hypothetical protein
VLADWRATLVALAMCSALHPALGQSVRYTITGTLTDSEGSPVAGAEVVIAQAGASDLTVRSDSAGRFTNAQLVGPSLVLHVRRLGFQPKSVDVTIRGADRRSSVIIILDPMAAELNAVSVLDTEGPIDIHLRDFYARKSTNSFGHYVEQAAIEKRRPQFVSEMLRSMGGIALSPSGRIGNLVRIRGCPPLVWLDGVRVTGSQVDEIVQPSEVAAMEIYSSFAGIPAQFFDRSATCGTILVWTRTK